MSRQNAHPLICDARVFTSSSRPCSSPLPRTYSSRPYITLSGSGVSFMKFSRGSIVRPLPGSGAIASVTATRDTRGPAAQLVGVESHVQPAHVPAVRGEGDDLDGFARDGER